MKIPLKIFYLFLLFSSVNLLAQEVQIYSYSVKGVIKQLPDAAKAKSALMIKHQEIPDYVGDDGKVVGMHAMTMPFSVGENINLSQFKVGDCIKFSFDSWWKPKAGDKITEMQKIDCE